MEIGALASEYLAMRKALWDRQGNPSASEVEALLNYHQQILEQASILAYRPRTAQWSEVAERFGSGDSDSSKRLVQLASEC